MIYIAFRSLLVYPNGDCKESRSFVGVYLKFLGTDAPESVQFKAKYKLGVQGNYGQRDFMGFELEMSREKFETIPAFGQDRLIPHKTLFDPTLNYITFDLKCSMTIICEVNNRMRV